MNKLFVVSAPSGAGKNTLIQAAISQLPALRYSISATTRKPRPGEINGKDYFFKTLDEFRLMIEQNELLEYQEVYEGVFYGTPRHFILDSFKAGQSVILDIDVFGCTQLIKNFPEAVTLFIDVPSIDVLRERLLKRKSEAEAQVEERVRKAGEEIAYSRDKYRYRIVNDSLESAIRTFTEVIRNEMTENGK